MAQISPISSLPDPISSVPAAANKSGAANSSATKAASSPATDETQASPLQAQITRFSAVLNSLQANATTTRAQYVQAYNQVRAGTYEVNPEDVSKSIVDELLTTSQ